MRTNPLKFTVVFLCRNITLLTARKPRVDASTEELVMKSVANDESAARAERVIGHEILCRLSLNHVHYDIHVMFHA